MNFKLFLYFFFILWTRIPKYQVGEYVSNFLEENQIYDCFHHYPQPDILHLKCLKDGQLVNVKFGLNDDKYITLYLKPLESVTI